MENTYSRKNKYVYTSSYVLKKHKYLISETILGKDSDINGSYARTESIPFA